MKVTTGNFSGIWSMFVKIILCLMAMAAGFYVRGLIAGRNYTKETHSALTQPHEPYLYTLSAEPDIPQSSTQPDSWMHLDSLLMDALQNGSTMVEDLSGTLLESEFAHEVFTEEELKNLEQLSDLTTQLIEQLTEQTEKP